MLSPRSCLRPEHCCAAVSVALDHAVMEMLPKSRVPLPRRSANARETDTGARDDWSSVDTGRCRTPFVASLTGPDHRARKMQNSRTCLRRSRITQSATVSLHFCKSFPIVASRSTLLDAAQHCSARRVATFNLNQLMRTKSPDQHNPPQPHQTP